MGGVGRPGGNLSIRLGLIGAAETLDLISGEGSAATEFESSESERAEFDPLQLHHLMTDSSEESADFPVFPFAKDDFEQGGLSDHAKFANGVDFESPLLKTMAGPEAFKFLPSRRPGNENPVDLANPETGVGEFLREETIVGHDDKSLTVLIESADCEQTFGDRWEQINQAEATCRIIIGTEIPGWLVDGEVDFFFQFEALSVEMNFLLVGIDFDSESGDDDAIDFDSPGNDHLFASPARAATCSGEYSLEANQARVGRRRIIQSRSAIRCRLVGRRFSE